MRLTPWVFRDGGRDVDWLPRSSIETSDDVLGVVSLAEQGIGICQSYAFIVRERLLRGQLVELLPHAWEIEAILGDLCAASPAVGGGAGDD